MYKIREFECIGCKKIVSLRRNSGNTKYCSLVCYRNSSERPNNKTGKFIKCEWCKAECYKPSGQIREKNFCSMDCHNNFQGKSKVSYVCKICHCNFKWSKSRTTQANPTYCSTDCRLKDKQRLTEIAVLGNLSQQSKKGLNKLEIKGREILQELKVSFQEQVFMFNKFLVDVLIDDVKLIIQWDGEYWHEKPKRKRLDESQDAYFNKCGYYVLRITDRQIKEDLEKVYEDIKRAVQ